MTSPTLSWNLHGNDQLSGVLEKLDRTLTAVARKLDQTSGEARDMGRAMSGAESPARRLGQASDELSGRLERVRGRLAGAGSAAAQFGAAMVAAAALATASVARIGISTAAANEQAMISFELLLGSTAKATAFLAELQKFAEATPFEMPQLRTAASRLLAVGVQTRNIIPLLEALGDATSGMGTGAEGIERAVTALTQMQMKTKVSAEEMLQLTEAGIPAWQALADVLKVDVQTAMKMVEQRQVSAAAVFEAIEKKAGPAMKRLDGMMERQSTTLTGIWSTFKDKTSQALAKFFEPMMPGMKKAVDWAGTNLPKALDKIREWFSKPEVKQWLSEVGTELKELVKGNLPMLAENMKSFVQTILDNKEEIKIFLKILVGLLIMAAHATISLGTGTVLAVSAVVNAYRWMVDQALGQLHLLLAGAAAAFGWMPEIGPKLREAEKEFGQFRRKVNEELGNIEDREVRVGVRVGSGGRDTRGAQKRAGGGPVWAGEIYEWQEGGRTYMSPGVSGQVHSADTSRSMMSGGGSGDILGYLEVVHKTPDGKTIRTELLQLKRQSGLRRLGFEDD